MIAATRFGTGDAASIMAGANAAAAAAFGSRAARDDRADAAAALAAVAAGGAAFKPSPLPRSAEVEVPQGAREPTGDGAIGGGEPGATGSYSRWWSPEEDLILLDHVRSYGTRHWGVLKASGRLPHRDNKACCNRFILLKKRYLDQEGAPVYHGLTEPLSQGLTPALRSAHSQSELSFLSPTSPHDTTATTTTALSSPAAITSHRSFAHPHHPRGYLVTSSPHASTAAAAAASSVVAGSAVASAAAAAAAAAAGAMAGQPRGLPFPVGSDPGPTAEPSGGAGGSAVRVGLSAAFSKPEAAEEELCGLALTEGGKWEERKGGLAHGGMAHGGIAHVEMAHGGVMDGAMMDALLEAYDAGDGMQSTQQGMAGAHAAAHAMWTGGSHAMCRAAIGGSSSAATAMHGAGNMGKGAAHGGGVGAHAWAVERAIREGLRPHASTSFKTAARYAS
ncbi:unnamed protein product [Closterium sp. Naga37s-1]|nr:unnamed protein product [Closterium sp. Naga37s-1]